MGSPPAQSRPTWEAQLREKPRLDHLFAGFALSTLSYILLWLNLRTLLSDAAARVLSAGKIVATQSFSSEAPLIIVKLTDGSSLDIALTWQRSGLVSLIIFGFLFLFLVFPLGGSVWLKVSWLEFGFLIGLAWSFIRLLVAVLIAYYFGAGAFTVVEFFAGPFTDFFWMVLVWSLGLSTLVSSKDKRRR